MPTPDLGVVVAEPPRDCPLCPRLVAYRAENRAAHPDWWNGPAPSFGDANAGLLVLGLAPGRTGANRTGRPFTGDHAGIMLYDTLIKTGFAKGEYQARPDDGLQLIDCMISNAVRCAPPGNKPEISEEAHCRPFLTARLAALPRLKTQAIPGGVVTPPPAEAPAPDPIGDLLSGNPAPTEAPAEKPKTEDIPL